MSTIEDMLSSIDKLAALGERATAIAAPLVRDAVRATAAAGTSPDGKPWTPKKDGTRPMANAADAIDVSASGRTIRVTLKAPETWHHFSKRYPRPVIPAGAMPANVAEALRKAADAAFDEATR